MVALQPGTSVSTRDLSKYHKQHKYFHQTADCLYLPFPSQKTGPIFVGEKTRRIIGVSGPVCSAPPPFLAFTSQDPATE